MAQSPSIKIESTYVDPAGGIKDGRNPVILLHPMLCSKEIWGEIPKIVADKTGRRVYTYDARNHGKSTHTEDCDFGLNVYDLFRLMDKIKADMTEQPDQVILVGYDMGGITAINAALEKEKKFEKVIIVEMYAKRVPVELIERATTFMTTWTECVRDLPKDTPLEDVTRLSVENLYKKLPPDMQLDNEKKSYQSGKFLYVKTDKGYDAHYNTGYLAKALKKLQEESKEYSGIYNGLAYFIYGTGSHYEVNNEKDVMEKHFPEAKLVSVEKASHFFIANMPAELAEKLGESINAKPKE